MMRNVNLIIYGPSPRKSIEVRGEYSEEREEKKKWKTEEEKDETKGTGGKIISLHSKNTRVSMTRETKKKSVTST